MPVSALLRALRRRVGRAAARRALDDELRFHLDMEVAHNERLGYPPRVARTKARRELGDLGPWGTEPDGRAVGGPLDALRRDLRLAFRALHRAPAFSAVALLTLALAIGVSTAVFSAVDGVLLRPLPFADPDALVRLYERTANSDRANWTGANLRDVEASSRTLAGVAYASVGEQTVLGADEPQRARVALTSHGFFDVLGIRPLHGRTATAAEGRGDGPYVVVVSHAFWRSALGGDPDVLGRTLEIGGTRAPIVGVMPATAILPSRTDVWVAVEDDNPHRTAHNWPLVIGRLAPGATAAAAQAEVDALLRRLKATHGEAMSADGAQLFPLHAELGRTSRTTLLVLLGAVGCVVLIGCVNLASASLARGETRHREFAVRTALGAGRGRIVRQLLTENLVLAALGGAVGVALAYALTRALATFAAPALPGFATLRVDGRVLAFAAATTALAGVLVGLAPALAVTRDLRGAISTGGRAGIGGGRLRARAALIAGEVALAVVLLAGAGLLVRSLGALLGEELGFRPERVLTADVSLPRSAYPDTTRIASYFDRLLPAIRALPGVEAASVINAAPLSGGGSNSSFAVDGGTTFVGSADYRVVDAGYFRTLGIPLLAGRGFGAEDRAGAPHAVLVNEAAARRFWPGATPLGHRVRFPGMDQHKELWLIVVGVVGNVRGDALGTAPAPAMFIHYPQRPENLGSATLVVRGTAAPAALAAAVRAQVRALDANVPVRLSSLDAIVTTSVAPQRFSTGVLTTFAALALALAALGIYGVLAYAVAQRQREIGVRMALGAGRSTVRAMVLRDAMRAVLPGAAVGVAGALALTRLLQGMLYGVGATDPLAFGAALGLLAAVALAAAWIPARRATRVDPLTAIRAE